MVSEERVQEMIKENADWAREHGYEERAQWYEQQSDARRAQSGQQTDQQQGTGEATETAS
jgi:hypothetical protein